MSVFLCVEVVIDSKGPQSATLLKMRLRQVFSCKSCEIFKNSFFTKHLRAKASEAIRTVHEIILGAVQLLIKLKPAGQLSYENKF